MIDYHLHSDLSFDSEAPLMTMAGALAAKGFTRVCFTQHIDLEDPFALGTPEKGRVDIKSYQEQIEGARRAYPNMDIGMGLELGYTKASKGEMTAIAQGAGLDFWLLSTHLVKGVDPYEGERFFGGRPRHEAYMDYLMAVLETLRDMDDFDAMAHLGYIAKPAPYPPDEARLRLEDGRDVIDEILRILIHKGKALEVNTSRWDGFDEGIPGDEIIARYLALGGELITIGSDAHGPEAVGQGYPMVYERLKGLGVRYIATFKGRRLTQNPIG